MIADVDNPARPGLFQGIVNGVEAFGKYINGTTGKLAGRNVQVDFIDSKLSADEARNAVIKACQEDFAIVGTSALFLNNVQPLEQCVDKAGQADRAARRPHPPDRGRAPVLGDLVPGDRARARLLDARTRSRRRTDPQWVRSTTSRRRTRTFTASG